MEQARFRGVLVRGCSAAVVGIICSTVTFIFSLEEAVLRIQHSKNGMEAQLYERTDVVQALLGRDWNRSRCFVHGLLVRSAR